MTAERTSALLDLRGVSMRFGGLSVLDTLDLAVAPGEILGIIGPNGAGKTTLFNVIAGVLPPSEGRLIFDGRDVTGQKVWHRCRMGIGRTYQIPKPFGKMSVFENVMAAAIHGGGVSIHTARGRAEEVLERTGLLHRATLEAERLSLLDLKRLELAKALGQRPRLLLLDEIAGGLTQAECDVLLQIVRQTHVEGTTIVWIEHVIHALRSIAGRMVVLYGGKLIADDTPDAVLADERVRSVYLGEVT
ncbi:ABC transporter ATP-binding protein [Acidimangrovimonas sediminis]|uniref:ABC transporter ATP-binding protein n=1 Tax=Acidimangrovimonas sediminis TaxID=2056283 RepID=UPI000C800F4E|nr:ABC transporter ATP-binding protein [Acidimangrovimonas sediminis]